MNRREFLKKSLACAGAAGLATFASKAFAVEEDAAPDPSADAMVLIWLPGGIAQQDTWDAKVHTPFTAGMKGSEVLTTCPVIRTSVDGIQFGAGLENLAKIMHKGTLLRTLASDVHFGAVHLKAQYYMMTGYLSGSTGGVKPPSMGAVVSRTRGRRDPNVPAYVYIGRDIDTSDGEKLFIREYLGAGFYGIEHEPFMVPDPSKGMATLYAAAGIDGARYDRRLALLKGVVERDPAQLKDSAEAARYLRTIADARAMMDSPVKRAFDFERDEHPMTLQAYSPDITLADMTLKDYDYGKRFGQSLLLARRLVEAGSRFIQVEYQYGPFRGFDMHESGAVRMREMKKQIDRQIATLLNDLEQRGLLKRTLVVIATEFGRSIANLAAGGTEPDGLAETHNGENLTITDQKQFGFHGHFSSNNQMLFFGGGFKEGYAHGKTADRHPMVTVEGAVSHTDVHATIYHALGISPKTSYDIEARPFYVTKDGNGKVVAPLLS